jgi:hypothetical protein
MCGLQIVPPQTRVRGGTILSDVVRLIGWRRWRWHERKEFRQSRNCICRLPLILTRCPNHGLSGYGTFSDFLAHNSAAERAKRLTAICNVPDWIQRRWRWCGWCLSDRRLNWRGRCWNNGAVEKEGPIIPQLCCPIGSTLCYAKRPSGPAIGPRKKAKLVGRKIPTVDRVARSPLKTLDRGTGASTDLTIHPTCVKAEVV